MISRFPFAARALGMSAAAEARAERDESAFKQALSDLPIMEYLDDAIPHIVADAVFDARISCPPEDARAMVIDELRKMLGELGA